VDNTHWTKLAERAQPHVPKAFTTRVVLHVHRGTVRKIEARQTYRPVVEKIAPVPLGAVR
jgi:hypothetical protein